MDECLEEVEMMLCHSSIDSVQIVFDFFRDKKMHNLWISINVNTTEF